MLGENRYRIVLVGNHLPRQCGIATFTTDLLSALAREEAVECSAVVINDVPEGYAYPSAVRFELNQQALPEYRQVCDYLNMSRVDVVCVQHEYGIFGGEDGAHILELMSGLRMPIVTTLHTVLDEPSPGQFEVARRIAQLSDRLVVMSHRAETILCEVYGVPARKIVHIPHGIPDVAFVDPNYYKDQFGVEGRKVILTFGLLSPGKGIETAIDALPAVVEKHPEAIYIVLGATHPHIRKASGEGYRLSLQRRARELGVADHLVFHNRFVDLRELCEFLGAADIYVTPYLNKRQIVSGTLAYALGSGKAVVSTPYWYAEEMLAEGRGVLTPFQDSDALAGRIIDLFDNETERHAMRKRAYMFCRDMVWKEVARKYLEVFAQVRAERAQKPRPVFQPRTVWPDIRETPQPDADHIVRLTDDVGILQHAKFIVPDRDHGYCTDDNARALIAVLLAQDVLPRTRHVERLACIYLSFLQHAFNEENGRFRNFMSYDRRWLEEVGSEDSHGRAIWGLGEAVALGGADDLHGAAQRIFDQALPAMAEFTSPRAWAFGLVGIHAYLRRFSGDSAVRRMRETLAGRLYGLFERHATDDWPWFEDQVTYDNGRIAQALILSGQWMQDEAILQAGLRSLEWLAGIQFDPKGHFVPIGSNGWYSRDGRRARFDQQPVEALAMIDACREAHNVTRDAKWTDYAQRCLEWFLGRNDLRVPLYDYRSGGCRDGLHPDRPNMNQGAESTLACFLSLLAIHRMHGKQSGIAAGESAAARAAQEDA